MIDHNTNILNTNIIKVDGAAGALSYPVSRGYRMVLFDNNVDKFYIKSIDMNSGTQIVREFDYEEVIKETPEQAQNDKMMDMMEKMIAQLNEFGSRLDKLEDNRHYKYKEVQRNRNNKGDSHE